MLVRPSVEDFFVWYDSGVELHHERFGRVHDVLVGWIFLLATGVPTPNEDSEVSDVGIREIAQSRKKVH